MRSSAGWNAAAVECVDARRRATCGWNLERLVPALVTEVEKKYAPAMNAPGLVRQQWEGYTRYHQSRANLLLHVVAVPVFVAGNVVAVVALAQRSWLAALSGFAAMLASVVAQGRGHATEPVPPQPFTSPLNAVLRIFSEQWLTFPRFVVSGGWSRALRRRGAP